MVVSVRRHRSTDFNAALSTPTDLTVTESQEVLEKVLENKDRPPGEKSPDAITFRGLKNKAETQEHKTVSDLLISERDGEDFI